MNEILKQNVTVLNFTYILEIVGDRKRKTCSYCQVKLTFANRSMDHIIPNWMVKRFSVKKEKDYLNRINKVRCCSTCNVEKSGLTLLEWRIKLLPRPIGRNLRILESISKMLR